MSEFRIVPREESGLGSVVTNINGTPRARLRGVRWFTIHYTGVTKVYGDADVSSHLRHLQQIWATTKPWEYNYAIGQREDDKIHEFAGEFQAAHARGNNHDALGIYFLNGISEAPTDTQVRKAQWLRDWLVANGTLQPVPETEPHQRMPGASTSCPGGLIMARFADIVKPYQPPTTGEVEMTQEQYDALIVRLDTVDTKLDALLSQGRTQAFRQNWVNNERLPQMSRTLADINADVKRLADAGATVEPGA